MADPKDLSRNIAKVRDVDGMGVFGIARVIGRNDDHNHGRVRIFPMSNPFEWKYIENKNVEYYPFAEVIAPKGENHGTFYAPEFGDFVIYTKIAAGHYILGSINNPSWEYSGMNIPVEAQNTQENGSEYNTSFYPDLTSKGYHLASPQFGDSYQPSAFVQRWRGNDTIAYNTTKIGTNAHSAAKLVEHRSSENNMLQLVDIGNFNTKPGKDGKNNKGYSAARQTDYRDLWEGFDVNTEFWTERSDKPPLTNESTYCKLASNGHAGKSVSEANHGDTGGDYPDLSRGEVRWDNRTSDGSHETPKTYCSVYQTVKSAMGPDRYYQDKPGESPWGKSAPHRFKVKKWVEDTGGASDPEVQHFNVGHYLTLSNTIFKRRAMLATAKGHKLVMSDIDKDEKIQMNSHRGKHIYMEDGQPGSYNAMWIASEKHHIVFCDWMAPPFLINDKGASRDKLTDQNQPGEAGGDYLLLQTGGAHKIWLADSGNCPRIQIKTTAGHEIVLVDKDTGTVGCVGPPGKIQITTADGLMQILMDIESGDMVFMNNCKAGNIRMWAKGKIDIEAKDQIKIHSNTQILMVAPPITENPAIYPIPGPSFKGSPNAVIGTPSGALVNKFSPS